LEAASGTKLFRVTRRPGFAPNPLPGASFRAMKVKQKTKDVPILELYYGKILNLSNL
jgi:hypothetical protein